MLTREVVNGFYILSENGERLIGSPLVITDEAKELEKNLYKKIKEGGSDILLYKEHLVLYKQVEDVCLVLYSPIEENEIMLHNALNAFYNAAIKVTKGPLTRKSIEKHYDEVFLLLDAFIYKTVITSDTASDLYKNVPKRTFEGLDAVQMPTKLSSAIKKAQKSFASGWFRRG